MTGECRRAWSSSFATSPSAGRPSEQIESAKDYAESIVTTVREPLLVLDAALHIRSANRSFYQTFRVAPAETEGRFIYDLGTGNGTSRP